MGKVGAPDRANLAIWWWRYSVLEVEPVYKPDERAKWNQTSGQRHRARKLNALGGGVTKKEWKNKALMLNAELTQQAGQFNASQQNAINSQIMALNTELNTQYLRGTQALDLATIQGQFQTLITNNAIAGEMFSGYMNVIGNIMANPDMDPGRVASAIQIQQNMLTQGLTFIGQINNQDWSKFMPAGTSTPKPATNTPSFASMLAA